MRTEVTKSYLATTPLSIAQIAAELGFSNTASLSRAFKGWTGQTLGEYRQSHSKSPSTSLG